MCALASHIRDRRNRVLGDIVLDVQMPLLHVGPLRFVGNGNEAQRAGRVSLGDDVVITRDINDRNRLGKRVVLLQRARICFALIGVLEEDAVAPTEGPLAVALGIPGESKSRCGVEEMALHATVGHAPRDPALHPSVVRVANYQTRVRIDAACSGNVMRGIKVPGGVMDLAVGAEHADPQTQVDGQATGGVPVILEVGFKDLIAVVGLDGCFFLLEVCHLPEQQVGKSVSAGDR